MLTIAPVVRLTLRSVKRSNMDSHVFVPDAVAIKSECAAARIATDEERNKCKRQKSSERYVHGHLR